MVTDSSSDLSKIASFRSFVRSRGGNFKNDRLKFAYVYVNKQKEFVMAFFDGLSSQERSSLQVSYFTVCEKICKPPSDALKSLISMGSLQKRCE